MQGRLEATALALERRRRQAREEAAALNSAAAAVEAVAPSQAAVDAQRNEREQAAPMETKGRVGPAAVGKATTEARGGGVTKAAPPRVKAAMGKAVRAGPAGALSSGWHAARPRGG